MAKTILVVDDDPHIRDVVVFAVEKAGMAASEVSDGRQALEKAKGAEYDLIVLDINMPEMDGLEVCKEIRKRPMSRFFFSLRVMRRSTEFWGWSWGR